MEQLRYFTLQGRMVFCAMWDGVCDFAGSGSEGLVWFCRFGQFMRFLRSGAVEFCVLVTLRQAGRLGVLRGDLKAITGFCRSREEAAVLQEEL